jgi:hypothetical protein
LTKDEAKMGDVIPFDHAKGMKSRTPSRLSLCPLCDRPNYGVESAKGDLTFICENVHHGCFTWSEPALAAFGMLRS